MNTDKIYAESVAKEYAPKENSKINALRKLDRKAKSPAIIFAYTFGAGYILVGAMSRSWWMLTISAYY